MFIFTWTIHVSCQCHFQKQHLLRRKNEAQVKGREKTEACGGVAVKSSVMWLLCAKSGEKDGGKKQREDKEESVMVLSGRRGVQDGIAHRNMSLWVHTHYTPPPHMVVLLQPCTHIRTLPVLPHSRTHSLVPRWFMWVHMSMFLHIFHSVYSDPNLYTPAAPPGTSRENKWDQPHSPANITYNSAQS